MNKEKQIDWYITLIPFTLIFLLCGFFFLYPDSSNIVLENIRAFLGDKFGVFYLFTGFGMFLLSIYIACGKYGKIVLGKPNEKPKYNFFTWGSMMFTSGLAADILFYSFSEWILYARDPHIEKMGSMQDWSSAYPIFHWGPIPWSFYLVLAVSFGFMLHVRDRKRQRYSESCRAILGKRTDGILGRLIDLLAIFALLAGTATTFSIATPLMSDIIRDLFHIEYSEKSISILILLITCVLYTYSVLKGMKGISILAKSCIYLFFTLMLYVLIFGGECRYIIETGFSAIGRVMENFISLCTYTDPLREDSFAQNWTIFYWAYWMVWCVASPFFIGSISRGRTIRETILGGYIFGIGATATSFIVFGNYSLGLELMGKLPVLSIYNRAGNLYETVIAIVHTLPFAPIVLIILLITMIAFYATSFDAIALVASAYSYKEIENTEDASKKVKTFWSILLIMLPLALVFSESSMNNLQSVSIIAAFPIAFVIILITLSFLKDARDYMENEIKD